MTHSAHYRTPALFTLFFVASLFTVAHADDEEQRLPDIIQIQGTGRVSVAPDKADLTLAVEVQAKSAESARNQAASAMTALIKAVKRAGVQDKDIQTRYVSLYPVYAPNTANKISAYQLAHQVTIIVRDIGKISEVIDSTVAAGGNAVRVQGISFSLDKPDSALAQARDKAFADARSKAEHYANLAKVKLGRAIRISEGGGMPPIPVPFSDISAVRMKAEASDSTPVQVGEQEVAVTVEVVFAIQ